MNNSNSLIEGNILKSLIRFALPILGALFLQATYGAVDLLVVGQFAETADVSGVATGSMLVHAIMMITIGLGMGITIMLGEAIGSGEKEKSSQIVGNGIWLFTSFGFFTALILFFGAEKLSYLMSAPDEAFDQTATYIKICGLGFIFITFYNVLGSIFRGIGDSKTPLITVAIACVINILADLIFVAVFKLNTAGAALATVLSQGLSVVFSLVFLSKKKNLPFKLTREAMKIKKSILAKLLFLGTPIALQDLLVSISFLVIQTIVNSIGVIESAGVGVAEKVCAFLMLVPSAYMQAMSAFVAQNMGTGRPDRAKKALLCGISTSIAVGILMFFLAFFHGDMLSAIFDNNKAVVTASHSYLKAYGIDCLLTAFLFCFMGYFNGCEKTIFVMLQGIAGAFLVRVPVCFYMSSLPDTDLFLIGLATPASSLVQILLSLAMFFYMENKTGKRKKTKL